jgi:hypothetical protein
MLALLSAMLLFGSSTLLLLPHVSWGRLSRGLRTLSRSTGLAIGGAAGMVLILVSQTVSNTLVTVLLYVLALLCMLFFGLYLPGMESRAHAARRRRLQVQTIDFSGYMMLALNSTAGEVTVLREYIRQPRKSVRDVQLVIQQALDEHERLGRGSLWDRLHEAAVESASETLIDLASTLREIVQQDRRQVMSALTNLRQQLVERTLATFKAKAQRLEWVVLGVTACSLFMGLMVFILYVITGGLTVFNFNV